MLSEESKMQKTTYCMVLFIGNVQKRQIHRGRKYIHGNQGWGMGGNGDKGEMKMF